MLVPLLKEASDAAAKEQAERMAAFNAELASRSAEAEQNIRVATAAAEHNLEQPLHLQRQGTGC